MRMMLQAPTCMPDLVRLGASVLARQKLDARLREIAILRVAALSAAEYEWTQHAAIGTAVGVTPPEMSALREETPAGLEPAADLVVRFTDECVRGVRVSDSTFQEALGRFSPQEITELVITIGYYMLIARFLETLGVDAEPAPPEMARSLLARRRPGG